MPYTIDRFFGNHQSDDNDQILGILPLELPATFDPSYWMAVFPDSSSRHEISYPAVPYEFSPPLKIQADRDVAKFGAWKAVYPDSSSRHNIVHGAEIPYPPFVEGLPDIPPVPGLVGNAVRVITGYPTSWITEEI